MSACCFIGHNRWLYHTDILVDIQEAAESLIQHGVDQFYNACLGRFEWNCAIAIYLLQSKYPSIKQDLVFPSRRCSFHIDTDENSFFNRVIYVDQNTAVDWMIAHSQHMICFVEHDCGMTSTYVQRAKQAGLNIIRVGHSDYHYPCHL